MLKRFATLLTLLTALFLFNACDDAPQITKTIIDEILTEPIPVTQSRYTGRLLPIGERNFGSNIEDPVAIEWNGQQLYMIAGGLHNQYLFTVDRQTGIATVVNRNAKSLGGTFMIYEIEFKDMTWDPNTNQMFAVDYRGNGAIHPINLQTGFAGRKVSRKAFGLYKPNGYPVIGSPIAIAYTEQNFHMWGWNVSPNFGALYEIPNLNTATPIGERKIYANGDETTAYSLCYDGEFLYMSGADTQSLYIIDPKTADLYFIAKWQYTQMPRGIRKYDETHYINMTDPEYPTGITGQIWITGITYDGTNMYAVDSFSDALYKLEKR